MAFLQVGADATLQGPTHKAGYYFGALKSIDERPSKADTTKHVLHTSIVPDPSFGLPSGTVGKFYVAQGSDGRYNEGNTLRLAMAVWRVPLEAARQRLMGGVDTSALVGGTVFYSVTVEPKKEGDKYDNIVVQPLVPAEIQEAVARGHYPAQVLSQINGQQAGNPPQQGGFAPPPQQGAPQGGGFAPQQGGFGQQQGGFAPQQGGGGGFAPQQGGFGQQQGGFAPQQGGFPGAGGFGQ